MEQLILKVLGFDISVPTIYTILQHIAVECNLSVRLTNLAQVSWSNILNNHMSTSQIWRLSLHKNQYLKQNNTFVLPNI